MTQHDDGLHLEHHGRRRPDGGAVLAVSSAVVALAPLVDEIIALHAHGERALRVGGDRR